MTELIRYIVKLKQKNKGQVDRQTDSNILTNQVFKTSQRNPPGMPPQGSQFEFLGVSG